MGGKCSFEVLVRMWNVVGLSGNGDVCEEL